MIKAQSLHTLIQRPTQTLWPWARATRQAARYRIAKRRATLASQLRPPVFIVGCGRSGTTVLGQALSLHPQTAYLFEPYHLWAAADPRTDAINLHHRGEAACMLRARDASPEIRSRYEALFFSGREVKQGRRLIEKTPLNAMRLGYLDALSPEAQFIHIARDGVEVARSIDRLATENTYRIAGKASFNQWWGVDDAKWRFLLRDAAEAGYWPDEAAALRSNLQRGAYEWLVSLSELEPQRAAMENRFHEVRFPELLSEPASVLDDLRQRLGLSPDPDWRRQACERIEPRSEPQGEALSLPPAIAEAFNSFQRRFGFSGRAEPAADAAESAARRPDASPSQAG